MKVIINRGAAPFKFSQDVLKKLFDIGHPEVRKNGRHYSVRYATHDVLRDDKKTIKIVEKLGEKANTLLVNFKIIEIPDGIEYYVHRVGNTEEIHEKHRVWK